MQNPPTQNNDAHMTLPRATDSRKVWLHVGTLFDGETDRALHNVHVVYDAASILYVAENHNPPPASVINFGQSLPDLHLPEFTLLPGLIEAHAHLFLQGGELDPEARGAYLKEPHAKVLEDGRRRLEKIIQLGVIGVRDAGDKMGVGLTLSKLYDSGKMPVSAYCDSPGAAIYHRGEYGGFMADPAEDFTSPGDCVRSRVQKGADRIKLIVSDAIDFKSGSVNRPPQMTASEVHEFVAAANEVRKQSFAHATGELGIENAIEGGVDSVEHGFFIRDDQLERMRDRQIAWAPTFSPVQKQIDLADRLGWDQKTVSHMRRILDQHGASLLKAERIGVPIIAGSDAGAMGVPHGVGLIDELCLMENAGLPSHSVLRTATGNGSLRLAFREKFGIIKPGYKSRFILTRHSPLLSVANLRKEKCVVVDGVPFLRPGQFTAEGL